VAALCDSYIRDRLTRAEWDLSITTGEVTGERIGEAFGDLDGAIGLDPGYDLGRGKRELLRVGDPTERAPAQESYEQDCR
jgi:hypothetical protein